MEKSVISIVAIVFILGAVFLAAQSTIEGTGRSNIVPDDSGGQNQITTPVPGDGRDKVCFPEICVNVEVADTPDKRSLGLMFRESLGGNEGMLFIFPNEGIYPFWMKNTLIPLDMIWVNGDMKIVHIEHAVPCVTETCPSYRPANPAKYVVEVNAGFTDEKGIEIGDIVSID
ncbi:MAG: DUF192 domain-containing protein [Candidatus Diapherotrites archaeon]